MNFFKKLGAKVLGEKNEQLKSPSQGKRNTKKSKKSKRKMKGNNNKTCKKFCKNVFLPEKERVEKKFSKYYEPIAVLRKKKDKFDNEFADILEDEYLKSCNDVYCQKKCKNKKKWVKSFTQKRKTKLEKQGAMSGCRDLIKEFPDYYENI